MRESDEATLRILRRLAAEAAGGAHAPYSGRREAALLLLSDGAWVPGVRVESASFSLTIPRLVNAFSTAVAAGRRDVLAAVLSSPASPGEAAYFEATPAGAFAAMAPDVFIAAAAALPAAVGERLSPYLDAPEPDAASAGVALARTAARLAYVPESNFPVGCVLVTDEGRLLRGVNVEHPDWSHILCAERNAIGTAVSYGLSAYRTLYLSCPADPTGTPCGACRQLLAEHARETVLWMDRGKEQPEKATPEGLLPGSFSGRSLSRRP